MPLASLLAAHPPTVRARSQRAFPSLDAIARRCLEDLEASPARVTRRLTASAFGELASDAAGAAFLRRLQRAAGDASLRMTLECGAQGHALVLERDAALPETSKQRSPSADSADDQLGA